MNTAAIFHLRRFAFVLVALAGCLMAPEVFARKHSSFSISVGGPGYGVTYSDCRHCGGGWWNGYVGTGWGHSRHGRPHHYYGGYGGAYYSAPAYSYGGYYPSYYPSYSTVVVERPVVRRVYRVRDADRYDDDGYYDDDRVSHSDRYYDEDADDSDYGHLDRDYRD